jgi:hypothetical protein
MTSGNYVQVAARTAGRVPALARPVAATAAFPRHARKQGDATWLYVQSMLRTDDTVCTAATILQRSGWPRCLPTARMNRNQSRVPSLSE